MNGTAAANATNIVGIRNLPALSNGTVARPMNNSGPGIVTTLPGGSLASNNKTSGNGTRPAGLRGIATGLGVDKKEKELETAPKGLVLKVVEPGNSTLKVNKNLLN